MLDGLMDIAAPKLSILYCHGLPGSADEIITLVPAGCQMPSIQKPLDLKGFDQMLDSQAAGSVHLIGFSLGAMTAIKIAGQRPNAVNKLTLISPAAPLELGDFLPKMAGRAVFKAAQSGSALFKAFTAAQRLGVAIAPDKVIEAMFKDSPKADKELLSIPSFRAAIIRGLKSSLGPDRKNYHAAILSFVEPWALDLNDIKCPTVLHHGSSDNWAPIEMSHHLKQNMTEESELITYEGLGHYSTLHEALPRILAP